MKYIHPLVEVEKYNQVSVIPDYFIKIIVTYAVNMCSICVCVPYAYISCAFKYVCMCVHVRTCMCVYVQCMRIPTWFVCT